MFNDYSLFAGGKEGSVAQYRTVCEIVEHIIWGIWDGMRGCKIILYYEMSTNNLIFFRVGFFLLI